MTDTIIIHEAMPPTVLTLHLGPKGDAGAIDAEQLNRLQSDIDSKAPQAGTYSKNEVNGFLSLLSAQRQVKVVNDDYSIAGLENILIIKASVVITLPDATTYTHPLTIKNNSTGTVSLVPVLEQTIDSQSDLQITETNSSVDLIADGTNWLIT